MDAFIKDLENCFKNPLPGREAQIKMAPMLRKFPSVSQSKKYRESSVLILIYPEQSDYYTVFIKRPKYDGPHSGQISFPGGKSDPDETIIETALREAHEEIGIDFSKIKVLGILSPLEIPVSHLRVNPVVAFLPLKPNFFPDSREVDRIIELPINFFCNPSNRKVLTISEKHFSIEAPCYISGNDLIWGATAMIVSEFAELLCPFYSGNQLR